jgi:predicted AlkP superfamily pyrophosphatase or phosphodiesterase
VHRTVVLNVVGLTPKLVGDATPHLAAFARAGGMRPLATVLPAVTCTAQSSMLTGAAAPRARLRRQRLVLP